MKKDYYEILGVDKNASDDEIKKAFRKKAMEYHPDKNNGDDTKFKEINEAYSVLSNPEKRKKYDQFGSAEGNPFGQGGFGGFDFSQAGFGGQGGSFEFDLGDIFGDFFGGGFGGNSSTYKKKKYGSDIEVDLTISFKESVLGTKKILKIKRDKICNNCNGNGADKMAGFEKCSACSGKGIKTEIRNTPFGQIQSQKVCEICNGKGEIPKKKCSVCLGSGIVREEDEIKIHIPAGVESGQSLRVLGKGNEVPDGPAGDLYINIFVENDTNFERKGNDLYKKEYIKYSDVILGENIKVQGIEKEVKIKIPEGTKSGTKFRIKGEGVQTKPKGDLYVEVLISPPEKISKELKKKIKELKEEFEI